MSARFQRSRLGDVGAGASTGGGRGERGVEQQAGDGSSHAGDPTGTGTGRATLAPHDGLGEGGSASGPVRRPTSTTRGRFQTRIRRGSQRLHPVQRWGPGGRGGVRRASGALRHRGGELRLRGARRGPHARPAHPQPRRAEGRRREPRVRVAAHESPLHGHADVPQGPAEHLVPGQRWPGDLRRRHDPARHPRQGRHRLGRGVRQALQQAAARLRSGEGRLVHVGRPAVGGSHGRRTCRRSSTCTSPGTGTRTVDRRAARRPSPRCSNDPSRRERACVRACCWRHSCWRARTPARAQQPAPLTPQALDAALAATPQGADAERLADRVREWFGGSDRLAGRLGGAEDRRPAGRLGDRGASRGATDAEVPIVESDAVHFTRRLTRIGTTSVYATVAVAPAR